MFRIDTMTGGRFGNRVLQYNCLVQLSHMYGREPSCVSWSDSLPGRARNDGSAALNQGKYHCFENIVSQVNSLRDKDELSWKAVLEGDVHLAPSKDYTIHPYCLHNVFWKVSKRDPRDFFKIEEKYRKQFSPDVTNVGIHLRGGDIIRDDGNLGREIHSPEYYINSIELVESTHPNTEYYICTDDFNFDSYIKTVQFLKDKNIKYHLGSSDIFEDFSTLTECDITIASSSTFVVAANFIGKNKKIIHSKEWLDKNLNHERWNNKPTTPETRELQLSFDNFWIDLYNGGNDYYRLWRAV